MLRQKGIYKKQEIKHKEERGRPYSTPTRVTDFETILEHSPVHLIFKLY